MANSREYAQKDYIQNGAYYETNHLSRPLWYLDDFSASFDLADDIHIQGQAPDQSENIDKLKEMLEEALNEQKVSEAIDTLRAEF